MEYLRQIKNLTEFSQAFRAARLFHGVSAAIKGLMRILANIKARARCVREDLVQSKDLQTLSRAFFRVRRVSWSIYCNIRTY
jgi:hypothetical protein